MNKRHEKLIKSWMKKVQKAIDKAWIMRFEAKRFDHKIRAKMILEDPYIIVPEDLREDVKNKLEANSLEICQYLSCNEKTSKYYIDKQAHHIGHVCEKDIGQDFFEINGWLQEISIKEAKLLIILDYRLLERSV